MIKKKKFISGRAFKIELNRTCAVIAARGLEHSGVATQPLKWSYRSNLLLLIRLGRVIKPDNDSDKDYSQVGNMRDRCHTEQCSEKPTSYISLLHVACYSGPVKFQTSACDAVVGPPESCTWIFQCCTEKCFKVLTNKIIHQKITSKFCY